MHKFKYNFLNHSVIMIKCIFLNAVYMATIDGNT